MGILKARCEGKDSFFCAEVAETEHCAVAGEEWEGGVVEMGLEGWDESLRAIRWICGEWGCGIYGCVCTIELVVVEWGEWGTFVAEFLPLRIGRIAILVLRLLVHMFRGRLESRRSSTFPVEGDCVVGLMQLMLRQ